MKITNTLRTLASAALATGLLTAFAPAQAATVTLVSPFETTTYTPVSTTGIVEASTTGNATIYKKSPFTELGWDYLTAEATPYTLVYEGGTATYALTGTSLSLLWGSPDPQNTGAVEPVDYNLITFYKDGLEVDSINGTELYSSGVLITTAAYWVIETVAEFDTVVFAANGISFEYAFSAVPLPATGLLLLGALGGLGLMRKRKTA